ncbi:hypothetical protein VTK73DRAFT_5123 [Phialemonium thermophilum]|uniref:Uncharacterized protein n=1 Tax=Phialemonium thermophilum TaxID=223376 RepID=A0ABR3V4B9_9PEZI
MGRRRRDGPVEEAEPRAGDGDVELGAVLVVNLVTKREKAVPALYSKSVNCSELRGVPVNLEQVCFQDLRMLERRSKRSPKGLRAPSGEDQREMTRKEVRSKSRISSASTASPRWASCCSMTDRLGTRSWMMDAQAL